VFVDIVDFTQFAASVPPEESISLLRDLFGRYDEVIRRFDLEKIKTVGDSYMYVSGVTSEQADHCAAAVDAALDLLYETRQMGLAMGRELQVRIGLHSGPLVAGVVGYLLYFTLLDSLGPVEINLVGYVEPPVAAVVGWVALNEVISPNTVVGFAVIVVGFTLVKRQALASFVQGLRGP